MTPDDVTPDDWRDRLLDRALDETLGGDVPPDLSQPILAAAVEDSPSQIGELTMAASPAKHSMGVRTWVLAASLLMNCGLAAVLMAPGGDDPPVAVSGEESNRTDSGPRMPTGSRNDDPSQTNSGDTSSKDESESDEVDELADLVVPTVQSEETAEGEETAGDGQAAADELSIKEQRTRSEYNSRLEGLTTGKPTSGPSDKKSSESSYYRSDDVGYLPGEELSRAAGDENGDGAAPVSPPRITGMLAKPSSLSASQPTSQREHLSRLPARDYYSYYSSRSVALSLGSLEDTRGRWGFAERHRGFGFGLPGQWQGSPDGLGIGPGASGDRYDRIHENPFVPAIGGEAISTFSIDVDTASYANVRQMLLSGHQPPADAVRLEELVNYFDYNYEPPAPDSEVPFAAHVETTGCPWKPEHRLVRIGIKGREVAPEKRPLSNLVFLVDISGSMSSPEKLPLVKHGLKQLAQRLGENDRVAIVVYASQEGLALPSTPGTQSETIVAALDNLQSGGSTAGGAGITLAYQVAEDNFIQGGVNRVILCTDGDFNVGTTSTAELERLVEQKAKDTKVFLSAIGFGRGNLNDAMMEKITGIGNGNYYYADGEREAERIFVKGMTGMLVTIAKDVKIQVEFNPAKVAGYRLLGYENRMLKTQDFNDDTKDAGEIGAGHTVTCLYEIVPAGEKVEAADIDELKYQVPAGLTDAADTGELLTLKMRYKQPDEDKSSKLEWPISDAGGAFGQATGDLQFAASVASFGMLLRGSQYAGNANYDAVLEIAQSALGDDPQSERTEFLELVRAAKRLMPAQESSDAENAEPASSS